ncbi:MAG: SHOCT domain-containing protein [Carnobacterium sp.]|uniref:SHOCT domain-containing protein n=1 Tax=Carnobacterium sp. TaxID=48221 RepID=UPI003C724755
MGLFDRRTADEKQQAKIDKVTFMDTIKESGLSKIINIKPLNDTASMITAKSQTKMVVLKDSTIVISHTPLNHFNTVYDTVSYNFVDIEWLENIKSKGKKIVGRAIVGNILAGPAGMIIGGLTGKEKIKDKSTAVMVLQNPETKEVRMLSFACSALELNKYKSIPKIKLIEDEIIESEPATDSLDQIKKLKELLDIDAITQQEFDNKKKELLNA